MTGELQKISLEELETKKQKTLLKLNNVFGNPEKERKLNLELEEIEKQIAFFNNISILSTNHSKHKSYLSTVEIKSNKKDGIELNEDTEQVVSGVEELLKSTELTDAFELHEKVNIDDDVTLPEDMLPYQYLAKNGEAFAQYYLGVNYYNGILDKEPNYSKAVFWFEKASNNGYYYADYAMAICYLSGNGVLQNAKKGIDLLKSASENEVSDAQFELGRQYYLGENIEQDTDKWLSYMKMASDNGNEEAKNILFMVYSSSNYSQERFALAEKLNKENDVKGTVELGVCYLKGIGTEQNIQKALELFQKATNENNYAGMCYLALCYLEGTGITENKDKAISLFYKANQICEDDNPNPDPAFLLAKCYLNGSDSQQNYKKAFELLTISAKRDNNDAIYELAKCYDNGIGINKDKKTALKYYLISAKNGNPLSQLYVGKEFISNNSLSSEAGLEWLGKASKNGCVEADDYLSELVTFGKTGLAKEHDFAIELCNKILNSSEKQYYSNAYYRLGVIYETRTAFDIAVDYYNKGCQENSPLCQYRLALLIEKNKVKNAGLDDAISLYVKALNNGISAAEKELERLFLNDSISEEIIKSIRTEKINSDRYDGYVIKNTNIPHGKGTRFYNDSTHSGDFAFGHKHGNGTCTYKEGQTHSGEYKKDAIWNATGFFFIDHGTREEKAFKGIIKENKTYEGELFTRSTGKTTHISPSQKGKGCSKKKKGCGTYLLRFAIATTIIEFLVVVILEFLNK